jgi:hypothetical protein
MSQRISEYEQRIRERFPELVQDPIWPALEKMVQEDWRDSDELWFDGVQQHCIDLCKRLGLSFGPANCGYCEEPWPDAGDAPDGGKCPSCVAHDFEEVRKKVRAEAWYSALGPEERKAYDDSMRVYLAGLTARDVQ